MSMRNIAVGLTFLAALIGCQSNKGPALEPAKEPELLAPEKQRAVAVAEAAAARQTPTATTFCERCNIDVYALHDCGVSGRLITYSLARSSKCPYCIRLPRN
jgi:hypothetical protein